LGILTAVILAMFFVPYPLKLDAEGQLLPEERSYIYPSGQGRVVQFKVRQGDIVRPNTPIAIMADRDVAREIDEKMVDIKKSEAVCAILRSQSTDLRLKDDERKRKGDELAREEANLRSLKEQLEMLREQLNARTGRPGEFVVFAPEFPRARDARGPAVWRI